MASTYSPNGNVLPIDTKVTFLYVFLLLSEYDRLTEKGLKPQTNPYADKIIMPTEGGKFVEVPKNVQQYAISEWISKKNDEDNNLTSVKNNSDSEENNDDNKIHNDDCNCKKCSKKVTAYISTSNLCSSILFILICIVLVYFFKKQYETQTYEYNDYFGY